MKKFFVHPSALVESPHIGPRTRVWAFAHVLPGARIGADCNVCDHTFIEGDAVVGDRVTIKCGVQLWDGVTVEDDVFIGPNATFTNDPRPRSRQRPARFSPTRICRGASIGANATILPGIVIGERAMVGAGAVVASNVPANAIVVGNPAQIVGYVETPRTSAKVVSRAKPSAQGITKGSVRGVQVHRLPLVDDLRGALSFGEFERHVPFRPKRFFIVYDVSNKEIRGEHAHRAQHQFLVCVRGSVHAMYDDGRHREEIVLDAPNVALYMPPMTWGTQYRYSQDATLLVFSSHYYDPHDYIRSYDEFLAAVRKGKPRRPRP